jgi:beta-lactamase class A
MSSVRHRDTGCMTLDGFLDDLSIAGSAYAAPIGGGGGVGLYETEPVTPASVMKIQVALAAAEAIATGVLDGERQCVLAPEQRTPGPVGISLLTDEVRMSIRDLIPQMLTISDNTATDMLVALVGLDRINDLTSALGLTGTRITSDLRTMLDDMAREVGFADYPALAAHQPSSGAPSIQQLRHQLHASGALDPAHGSCTTAVDTVRLLQTIWTDTGASAQACATVRRAMAAQLTRHRIASGFGPDVTVAAKSGGLMGLVRNEAGVVGFAEGEQYAVAVFTRCPPDATVDPALIDAGIGRIARALVEQFRG